MNTLRIALFVGVYSLAAANYIPNLIPQTRENLENRISQNPWWSNHFDLALNHSDLDVRDENNQPIQSQSAKAVLKELFVSSVLSSLVTNELPLIAKVREKLMLMVAPLSEQFSRVYNWLSQRTETAFTLLLKRLTELLNPGINGILFILPLSFLLYIKFTDSSDTSSLLTKRNLPLQC